MAKRSYTKTPMREQSPEIRNQNFDEVALGYSLEEGQLEASRCLQCKNAPCITNCPVMIDIPGFIKAIEDADMPLAYEILSRYTNLPAICGRVCPQEKQCEMVCRLGRSKKFEPVAIGKLERLVADWALEQPVEYKEVSGDKGRVAVIGSGPSGLTAAGDLAKLGYDVTVYEALHAPGGVLTYGIPEFRLPKSTVKQEIERIVAQGVKIETNVVVGKTITMDEIITDFDACYLSVGAGAPRFQGIKGTSLNGVYSSSEYLTRVNLMHGYQFPQYDTPVQKSKNVVVIGGGNVAMDAARSAKRLGAEKVSIVYRRSLEELPAREEEYHHSVEEGIEYHWLTNPVEYINDGSGRLSAVKCVQMELGEPDDSGRRRPIVIPGSEFVIEADTAIEAIGQGANKVLLDTFPELALNKWGYIDADEETCATSIPGVFAGGDIVTGAATVILAMGAGKIAANEIDQYIQKTKQEQLV
ncbi:NADPH-dependent glutamate synthase [Enterococcus malodoratus]|uniref:Glutamate synthase (NADPH), homotetrameric n=1 Tax=Enterococcus malodoratus ATCC 43197 TaxID=1158601 RepID=R2PEN3_9ENTE|nr:NADPH-dependent glutamate synthase [Enterococcus malodoratus]BBM18099.1 oxidoreductase [Enterococcus avium]EOH82822.1 glutamate synthase (NADPH), homotetrameric [Enterococcus malodoratus ATCC 43197]EOT70638.1 glutamate synthase (NADPH), homotetrameric [Enterococcus malodoratus ATCC 43197]SET02205.1 glutamate synthase (NADPH/NADH) small chain [Enterococcus malodoratus]SPW86615.1 sulfide dehydrogenase (flavoprotein) subunit SudA [Enterococcus malodoratus]